MVKMSVGALVVDSGAFIKGAPVERWGERVYTVREVVEEIRDANTRRRLQVLPYDLVFREPTQAALHHVTMFAKKTGDYPNLSHVDMKLIALTYQLECELGPERGDNLRKEPQPTQPVVGRNKEPVTVGFYSGSNKSTQNTTATKMVDAKSSITDNEIHCVSEDGVADLETRLASVNVTEEQSCSEECHKSGSEEKTVSESQLDHIGVQNSSSTEAEWNGDGKNSERREDTSVGNDDDVGVEWNGERTVSDHLDPDGADGCEDDDDSADWITPENFEEACEKMGGVLEEQPSGLAVGCSTTDFAMQNVMLQMGLNVISLDGMRIRQLRTYALRCKACFKTTSNTSQVFCPHCGYQTLMKVSVLLDEDGAIHYRHLSDKQFSHKGLRYSLPLPKGGRHAHNPILAPDQRVTQKERRSRSNKVNPLDPDYVAQESPFAMKDVNSRGAKIASMNRVRGKVARRGRNPNAVQPKGRRK